MEEYPPDQREAMVAAIMKEIGDLCKIGVEDQARCRLGWHRGLRLSKTQLEGAPSTYSPIMSRKTVMDSLNLTHREAMYLLDHVGADKDIITLRLSTTEREEIKSTFFRGYQGPGRLLGTWEERGNGKKGTSDETP